MQHGRPRHYVRMPKRPRAAVYVILGALWISGCAWLLLDQCCAKRGPFGIEPHPLEPPLLLIHGVVAVVGMYLLGWITARHALRWWTAGLRRISGGVLAAMLAVLIVSGFALFFLSDDAWQRAAGLSHEVLGVVVTVFAIQHWFLHRRGS